MKSLSDISDHFREYRITDTGNVVIDSAVPVTDVPGRQLLSAVSWVSDARVTGLVESDFSLGLLICSENTFAILKEKKTAFLIAENPRLAFARVLEFLFTQPHEAGIAPSAIVHPISEMGEHCSIGHFVVIEENCRIGSHVVIGHHTVIHSGTVIGDRTHIGCHNSIGGAGFGYEKETDGSYFPVPHLGHVEIGNDVRIHNHVCIDRAVMGETQIGHGVKIDNHVHIAHGVQVGENSLLIAHAMIGGSVHIGKNCWIAPSVSVKNQVTIGDDAVIGMGAVVLKPVAAGTTVVGNPARVLLK